MTLIELNSRWQSAINCLGQLEADEQAVHLLERLVKRLQSNSTLKVADFSYEQKMARLSLAEAAFVRGEGITEEEMDRFFESLQ